jgi:hypothetical protein
MALITSDLRIPDIQTLMPATRRWRHVKPCGTPAAARRHLRQRGTVLVCDTCAASERARQAAYYAQRRAARLENSSAEVVAETAGTR